MQILPQLTSIENLYIKGGLFTATNTADYSAIAGLNSIELDTPSAILADATTFTVKTAATQTLRLDGVNTATTKAATVAVNGATTVTLNAVGTSSTNDGTVKLDLTSTTATSATLITAGAASKITLLNTPAKVATLTISGDQNLTLAEALTTLKTITASAATGKITVDTTGINGVDSTLATAFAFTGGSANDSLKLTQSSLQALTAGSQLIGGTGTDTLFVVGNTKAASDLIFAAADYKAINAATGFEILAIAPGAGKVATVDASQLTSIKEFAVSAITNTIAKVATGSTLDINGATTKTTVSGAVGVDDLIINIGTSTATSGIANTALDITGLTAITVNANIKAGTIGATHAFGTLTNSDNTTFTVKGNGDLTIALASETTTGSKIDGTASSGILTLTAGTAAFAAAKASLGDILIGGSGNDVITAGLNTTTVTGNGGNDSFVVAAAVVAATAGTINETIITDFTKGDSMTFDADFKTTSAVTKVDLSGKAAGLTDAAVFAFLVNTATGVKGDVLWGVYNGNTFVLEDTAGSAKAFDATDVAVKLTGVLDLSTSTHAADTVLVFA